MITKTGQLNPYLETDNVEYKKHEKRFFVLNSGVNLMMNILEMVHFWELWKLYGNLARLRLWMNLIMKKISKMK